MGSRPERGSFKRVEVVKMAERGARAGDDDDENNVNEPQETGIVASDAVRDEETDLNAQGDGSREQYQPTKLESFFAVTKSLIIRALVIYFITSFFRRPSATPAETTGVGAPVKLPAWNLFENGTLMDVYMYVSEENMLKNFSDESLLVWSEKNLVYGDWTFGPTGDGILKRTVQIETSQAVRNNGSLFLHVFVTKHGEPPSYSNTIPTAIKQLNRFKRLRYTKTHNLLTGETSASPEDIIKAETMKEEVVSHWHPNLTINFVVDQTNWIQGSVPPPLDEFIEFLPSGDRYKPVVYMNEFWNMIRDYQPINDTTTFLELQLTWQPLSLIKWQLYCAQSMRNKWSFNIMGDQEEEEDQDSLKEALLETSPYLLGITAVISILHSVFELLAFKNDIQFWNNRKSLEGLSVRSVFFNVFQALVVFLYVLDNDTNTVIKISCFVGLCIEIWKINKVIDFSLDRSGSFPRPRFTDKSSYVVSSTREYDMLAFRYLSWALYPLLGGYAVYALIYQEHRGWYSFVLNMLYGFLLTFGFIMMTPQLFINYKLKSVAHLPWRMMSYKFLNTFIDDIFAFVIKMPTLYRLGCFRDDIVFFIFLYQRWIYKTDLSRLNEFGFSAEMEEEVRQKALTKDADAAKTKPKAIDAIPPTDPKQKKKE